ncbi:MAG: hypothetical protein PHP50_13800 [Lachnospiraceae bacterium]|nr:hypothetical protein [Lachnospiraceae bacterium]
MKANTMRRFLVMLIGIIILGLGIAMFKISLMGNDPSSAFVMAVGDRIGVDFSRVLICANTVWFIMEALLGRKYIGLGTFVNWFGVGTIASLFVNYISAQWEISQSFGIRFMIMLVGILVLSLASSMYQTADMGIAPYDALSLILTDRMPIPYFWCRIFTDSICAVVAFLFGGIVGFGTLVCAVGLGPFISFFNKNVSEKLCGISSNE